MLENTLISLTHWYKNNPHFGGIRKWVNCLYHDPECVHVRSKDFDYVVVDGLKYHISDQLDSPQRIKGNDWFTSVKPDDTCLDLGANMGGIAIPLAVLASRGKVYALEPIFFDLLEKNMRLNGLKNIKILPYGLSSDDAPATYMYGNHVKQAGNKTFSEIKKICGKIDFLWSNCEGGEWDINPADLAGIRELRFMCHIRVASPESDRKHERALLNWLKGAGYMVDTSRPCPWQPNPLFKNCYWLKASKNGKS